MPLANRLANQCATASTPTPFCHSLRRRESGASGVCSAEYGPNADVRTGGGFCDRLGTGDRVVPDTGDGMPAAIMECSTHVKHRSAYSMRSTHMHAHRVDQVPGSSTTRGCTRYGLQANPSVEQPVGCTSGAFLRFTLTWPGSLLSISLPRISSPQLAKLSFPSNSFQREHYTLRESAMHRTMPPCRASELSAGAAVRLRNGQRSEQR